MANRLAGFGQDIRYAIRQLRGNRGFAAVAVITLALGIGVNTAVFSVVYGVLLNPYPYEKSDEIWVPAVADTGEERGMRFAVGDYLGMATLPAVASAMATATKWVALTGDQSPEMVAPAAVSGSAFGFLGVRPLLGRAISPADIDSHGQAEPVAVLNFKFWQARFSGDPTVIGRTIMLDDAPYTVIGVMPPRFDWYTNELWIPLGTADLTANVMPIVRLRPGASSEVAGQQLLALARRLAAEAPQRFPKGDFHAVFVNFLDGKRFGGEMVSGEMRASLHLLFYAVGFLLLIACTNVANLLLARGAARRREIAVRLALGAGRRRLIRQLLTESLGLALLGGLAGVLFAFGLTRLIVALMPSYYIPDEARVTMNGWVLAFSVGISMATGILFGIVPALQSTRSGVNDALKDGGHGASVMRGARTRDTLIVVEVALSIVLLVGATLMIRGFVDLEGIDRGFRTENALSLRVPFSPKRYPTQEQRNGLARLFLERVNSLPGVASAVIGTVPDLDSRSLVTITGQPKSTDWIPLNFIGADYLETLRIGLRSGRNLTPQEIAHGDHVALVSESAAKLWADGASPIGRTVAIDALAGGTAAQDSDSKVTIVGIVADTRARNLLVPPPRALFVPYTLRVVSNTTLFFVRTQINPGALVNPIRAVLRTLDPEQPMMVGVTAEAMDMQVAQPRFNMVLFGGLAAVALALSAAGIYSVLSYSVVQRTREIGIRMALGAQRGTVFRLILGKSLFLVLIGVAIGVPAAVGAGRLVSSRLYGLAPVDLPVLAITVVVMFAVAALAGFFPTRVATKVDPLSALRVE
jgi:putative ABC transport system permease protein